MHVFANPFTYNNLSFIILATGHNKHSGRQGIKVGWKHVHPGLPMAMSLLNNGKVFYLSHQNFGQELRDVHETTMIAISIK